MKNNVQEERIALFKVSHLVMCKVAPPSEVLNKVKTKILNQWSIINILYHNEIKYNKIF